MLSTFQNGFSFCITETFLGLTEIGIISDDEKFAKLKMLISQQMPKEVIYDTSKMTNDNGKLIIKILKELPTKPLITGVNPIAQNVNFFNGIVGFKKVESFFEELNSENEKKAEINDRIGQNHQNDSNKMIIEKQQTQSEIQFNQVMSSFTDEEEKESVWNVITGLVHYLSSLFIFKRYFSTTKFKKYNPNELSLTHMVLDSQALEHLEILEPQNTYQTKSNVKDSLFKYMDNCATSMGQRLLKKWVCSPLMNTEMINERLDACEDLDNYMSVRDDFCKTISGLTDLERTVNRLFSYSVKQNTKVILFEDVNVTR